MLHLLPIAAGVWLGGFLTALGIWAARWLRIRAMAARAVPLREGREIDALRILLASGMTEDESDMLLSRTSLEPGIFGIVHSVLLWPEGISEKLDDVHLEAVIAHELCHVRRCDNLAAAIHMLVEAAFWFHPLVWWVGSRLIDERERACDEEVLQLGGERHLYAESILKICEFCLSSPLTCVSGVTGAELKKRMVHIMTDRIVYKLNFSRKLLLWTAACLAIALPIAFGLFNATPSRAQAQLGTTPKFATVSIKPHGSEGKGFVMTKTMLSLADGCFTAANVSPHTLLQLAYQVQDSKVAGEPDWFNTAKYDIDARLDIVFCSVEPVWLSSNLRVLHVVSELKKRVRGNICSGEAAIGQGQHRLRHNEALAFAGMGLDRNGSELRRSPELHFRTAGRCVS